MIASVRELEGARAEDILRWAVRTYRGKIALACSFGGPTGMVALDLAMRVDRAIPVYYLDTGLLFAETHALVDRIRRRYAIEPIAVAPELSLAEQSERYGEALWRRDPDRCCTLRKIEPQREFLRGYDAWISGVRRDQTPDRHRIPVAGWDERFELVKIAPFAAWTEAKVWRYIREHDLPYNALHEQNYPSLGCIPCTRSIATGEPLRAGRWSGTGKIECGLHARIAARGAR